MRLIDADALIIALHDEGESQTKWGQLIRLLYSTMVAVINDAPTIDAVQVVRCKDCTAWQNGVNWPSDLPEDVGVCIIAGWTCGENGYCLYGKGRDDETD